MLWSSEMMTRFVIGAYMVLGGGIGALVGLAVRPVVPRSLFV
jgi:hypothetical protein